MLEESIKSPGKSGNSLPQNSKEEHLKEPV